MAHSVQTDNRSLCQCGHMSADHKEIGAGECRIFSCGCHYFWLGNTRVTYK